MVKYSNWITEMDNETLLIVYLGMVFTKVH